MMLENHQCLVSQAVLKTVGFCLDGIEESVLAFLDHGTVIGVKTSVLRCTNQSWLLQKSDL